MSKIAIKNRHQKLAHETHVHLLVPISFKSVNWVRRSKEMRCHKSLSYATEPEPQFYINHFAANDVHGSL